MSIRQLGFAALLLAATASVVRSQTIFTAPIIITPIQGPGLTPMNAAPPFIPSQIQTAYGISSLAANAQGAGQTIAIIDAYDYPNAPSVLNSFSSTYGLPQMNGAGQPTFTVLNETGGSTLPGTDPAGAGNNNWEFEEALDFEYAHTTAPKANIILYEGNSPSFSDFDTAINTAKNNAAVSVVSMSWGSGDFNGESGYDPVYTTPSARLTVHKGVTFVASSGDTGAQVIYPSASPNVVSVGGTSLTLNNNNTYQTESAWSAGGGGVSAYESKPSYQTSYGTLHGGLLSTATGRATPDISFDADPNTGVITYDPYNGGDFQIGGTSLSAPCWAGLIADADSLRTADNEGTLDGVSQTLPGIYSLPESDFNDVTSGSNGYSTLTGYDLATGIGSPKATLVIPALANYATPEPSTVALLGIAGLIAISRILGRRLLRRS